MADLSLSPSLSWLDVVMLLAQENGHNPHHVHMRQGEISDEYGASDDWIDAAFIIGCCNLTEDPVWGHVPIFPNPHHDILLSVN